MDQSGTSTTAASKADQRPADGEAGDGNDERKPGCDHRAEGEQQDDRGRGQPDSFGADLALFGQLDALSAQSHLESRSFRVGRGFDESLGIGNRHVDRVCNVQADVGEQGAAVGGDRARRGIWILDSRDMRLIGETPEQVRNRCLHRGVRCASFGAYDDVNGVAGLTREPVGQQLLGAGRV